MSEPKRLWLHACCGVCALEPTRVLLEEGTQLAIDYTNSNIHPAGEFVERRQALEEFVCTPQGLPLHVGKYDAEEWEREVGIHGLDREARCRACYRLRFTHIAAHAKAAGFKAISTTLTISPYQNHQAIREELEAAAAREGLQAHHRDWSEFYREATRRSKENGMYRQNYCGCRFSVAEAEETRRRLRAERDARKAARKAANIAANQPKKSTK